MNSRLGASPISSSQRFATPSPHRTGVPISDRFSIKSTSAPPRAAYFAAVLPVGPAPTTRTSTWRSICFGPIPSGLMRLWDRFDGKARTPTYAAAAVDCRPSPVLDMGWQPRVERRTYLVEFSTYVNHGAGNSEGSEAGVLESRGLPSEGLGGVEWHPAGRPRQPRD